MLRAEKTLHNDIIVNKNVGVNRKNKKSEKKSKKYEIAIDILGSVPLHRIV